MSCTHIQLTNWLSQLEHWMSIWAMPGRAVKKQHIINEQWALPILSFGTLLLEQHTFCEVRPINYAFCV